MAAGLPAGFAPVLAALLDQIAKGRDAHLADGVQRALGRRPSGAATFAWRAFGPVVEQGRRPATPVVE